MKKVLGMVLLLLMFATTAFCRPMIATFRYPLEDESKITGYRLYIDNGILLKDNIPTNVRTFVFDGPDDNLDHTYVLSAFNAYTEAKSNPYIYKWVAPVIVKPTYLNIKPQ